MYRKVKLLDFSSIFYIHIFRLLCHPFLCPRFHQTHFILFHPQVLVNVFHSVFRITSFHPLFPNATHEFHLHAGNRDYSPHQLVVRHFSSHKLATNCYTDFGIVGASITAHPTTNFSYDSHFYKLRVALSPPTFSLYVPTSLHQTSAITLTYHSSWS
jgi:hypothetical protein